VQLGLLRTCEQNVQIGDINKGEAQFKFF